MHSRARPSAAFWITVAVLWAALALAARFYPLAQGVPRPVLAAFVAAGAIEVALYAGLGFASVRSAWAGMGSRVRIGAALLVSAFAPWAVYATGSGTLRFESAGLLLLCAGAAAFYYAVLPGNDATDLVFLALFAAGALAGPFRSIYLTAPGAEKLPADMLGALMWTRLGVGALLAQRGAPDGGLGFLPDARDWKIGALCFAGFLPFGIALGWWSGFTHVNPAAFAPIGLAKAVAVFLGMLWVVAFREEFYFRGMLLLLARLLRSDLAGLLASSVLFGLVHLPFRSFPNWPMVGLATVAGIFYGIAFQRTGSVRAPMVAHALVNVVWRAFLSG